MITLSGTVKDRRTGETLPNVPVYVSDVNFIPASPGNGTITGMNGEYNLSVTAYSRVAASLLGYMPALTNLNDNPQQQFDFLLEPVTLQGPEATITSTRTYYTEAAVILIIVALMLAIFFMT